MADTSAPGADGLLDGLSLARSQCYVTQVNAKPDNTACVGSCGRGSGHRGATNVLRAQGIRIAAAGQVRLSSRDSVGRIILRSATDKARAVEILLANDIDAN